MRFFNCVFISDHTEYRSRLCGFRSGEKEETGERGNPDASHFVVFKSTSDRK